MRERASGPITVQALLDARRGGTKRSRSEVEQASRTREIAEVAYQEYVEGTFPSEVESQKGAIKLAEAQLVRADEALAGARKLLDRGFISSSQLQSTELDRQRARFALTEAKTRLMVLEKYTREKQLRELRSQLEAAMAREAEAAAALEDQEGQVAILARLAEGADGRPAEQRVRELIGEADDLEARAEAASKDERERLGAGALGKLADGLDLAAGIEAQREELRAAERELKQARDRLRAMEKRFRAGAAPTRR